MSLRRDFRRGLSRVDFKASNERKVYIMVKERYYYACVAMDVQDYFEEKLEEHEGEVRVLSRIPYLSKNGEPVVYYLLAAEEGIIDPKYEFKC